MNITWRGILIVLFAGSEVAAVFLPEPWRNRFIAAGLALYAISLF